MSSKKTNRRPVVCPSGTYKGMFWICDETSGKWMSDKGKWLFSCADKSRKNNGGYFHSRKIAQSTADHFCPQGKIITMGKEPKKEGDAAAGSAVLWKSRLVC